MRIYTSNIRNKIIFILSILVIIYVIAFFSNNEIDKRNTYYLYEEQRIVYYDNLEKILNIKGAAYKNVVENLYSRWTDLSEFLNNPDSSFAEKNIDVLLTRYDYDCVWICDSIQRIVYQKNATIDTFLNRLPIEQDIKEKLFTDSYSTHFFYKSQGGLLEIRGAIITTAETRSSIDRHEGYFFLGRLWDNIFLKDLEEAMGCNISIHDVGYEIDEKKALELNDIPVMKSLYGWNGKEVAIAEFLIHELLLEKFDAYASEVFLMFIVMAILILVIVSFFLIEWIYNPLRIISASLINKNPVGLDKLKKQDNEFGRLAILMSNFFRQRKKLENEISQRVHTEETLKRSEDRFRELIRHLPDYIVVHQEGIIVFVNDTTCEKLAYPKSEIMGSPILDFIDKDDHEMVGLSLMKRISGEDVEDYEISVYDSKNNRHSTIVRSSVITFDGKPAVLSVLIDITERKSHEQEILKSKARLNAILDNLPFKAWLKDIEGKFVAVNKPFASYYNMSQDEIVGMTDKDLCDEKIAEIYEVEDNEIVKTGKQSFCETQNAGMTEGEWYETFKSPIFDNEGNVIGITGIARDITEQKQRQNEWIKAKEDADTANVAKQQFLSTMSHEIRTPLNAIIGMSNLLIEEDPKDEQLENLRTLKYSANHLLSLISDILDFSKIEAGKIDLEENDFNIIDLLDGFIQMFKIKAAEKKLNLEYRIGEDVPENLKGDYVRLNQILTNLVGNAIKFTESGRVNLCIDLEDRKKNNCMIRFEILDSGIGIDNSKLKEIFEPFVQTGASNRGNVGGTGLGLAITKKLLDLQGGKIEVNSIQGKGSSFIFYMPYKISRKKNLVLNGNRTQKYELLKNVKVLLVEDNQINQLIAGKYLVKWGAIVDEAENGLVAFEKVKNNKYDVILMDIQMPEMNGYEATRSIRGLADKTRNNIPIIALTASAFLDVRDEVYRSGMNDFLTKPFNPEELNRKILQLIKKAAS